MQRHRELSVRVAAAEAELLAPVRARAAVKLPISR